MAKISIVIPVHNLENSIHDMLVSVQKQSFKDFEAIIVDDGSTDGSSDIIGEFSRGDSRFKVIRQENSGVSAARNRGMDDASGEYIIFFDGDDYVPRGALMKMYDAITEGGSFDMAVGIMETYDDSRAVRNRASERLAKRNEILPCDTGFIKTWSPCNKMYRLGFLKEHGIRFINLKVAEDGVFLYNVLSEKPKIRGCAQVVYRYIRHPFWEGVQTASKRIEAGYLNDRLTAYENIVRDVEKILENRSKEKRGRYKDELLTRFIKGGMIQAFYRRIWRCEDGIDELLSESIEKYRKELSEEAWEDISGDQWDVKINDMLRGDCRGTLKERIANEPLLSVILTSDIKYEDMEPVISGLYHQEFPSFELLVEKGAVSAESTGFTKAENIRIYDNKNADKKALLSEAKGEYICFIDKPIVFGIHSLEKMTRMLKEDESLGFVSAYMKHIKTGEKDIRKAFGALKHMDIAFPYSEKRSVMRSEFDAFDNAFANKVFRKSVLEAAFDGYDDIDNIGIIYKILNFRKTRSVYVFTTLSDKDFSHTFANDVNMFRAYARLCGNRITGVVKGRGFKKYAKEKLGLSGEK